jgi:hypothetical protein
MQANSSDFYKVRAAGLVCLLEGMLMAFKARELPDSDARVKTELFAAAMTTAAAGFEIGASYVDQVVTRYGANSVTGRGAAATLGRLKLWGGSLASIGGGVLAWWDFVDGVQNFTENSTSIKSWSLSGAYFTRAIATVVLSLAELGTAVALARPFFERLAHSSRHPILRALGHSMSTVSRALGTPAARILLARLVLGTFWIGLALTIIIFLLEDDALEKWCKRSSYRIDERSKPYADEELAKLHSAFREVL